MVLLSLLLNSAQSARNIAYFTAWGIYGRNYQPTDVPADKITHLNYAFANINNGECVLGDSYADIEKSYPGDSWDQPVKGSFNQLNNVTKLKHPSFKTIISVGGWTWSTYFSDVAATAAAREKFVNSCVTFMKKYHFDGIDLDWEYPVGGGLPSTHTRPDDGDNYLLLLRQFRQVLDHQAQLEGRADPYLLSIAAPAGFDKFKWLDLKKMSDILDWFNIMTYDFNGCWSNVSSHMANLHANPADPQIIDQRYNADYAVQAFLAAGVPASKINLGAAFYGRGVAKVQGSGSDWLFKKFGDCPQGTWDDWQSGHTGTYDYKDIVKKIASGWETYWDAVAQAPYIHGKEDDIVISYDNPQSLQAKVDYIKKYNLGGVFSWSLDGDSSSELINFLAAHV